MLRLNSQPLQLGLQVSSRPPTLDALLGCGWSRATLPCNWVIRLGSLAVQAPQDKHLTAVRRRRCLQQAAPAAMDVRAAVTQVLGSKGDEAVLDYVAGCLDEDFE